MTPRNNDENQEEEARESYNNLESPKLAPVIKPKVENQYTTATLLDELAATSLSILFTGVPGTGKSTLEQAWLATLFEKFPNSTVFIVCRKNDPYVGLEKVAGVVTRLNGSDFKPLVEVIELVYGIFSDRASMSKRDRNYLKSYPVWLVLADWYALFGVLKTSHKKVLDEIMPKINEIITIGRDLSVGVAADTHSILLSSLGFADDSQARQCLNIQALGRVGTDEHGQRQGNFSAIEGVLGNRYLMPNKEERQRLSERLQTLQPQSTTTGRPVVLSTMGGYNHLLILDDLSRFEMYQVPAPILKGFASRLGADEETTSESPSTVVTGHDADGHLDEPQSDAASITTDELLTTLYEWLKQKRLNRWVTPRDVQSGCWVLRQYKLSSQAIKLMFLELENRGLGTTKNDGQEFAVNAEADFEQS